METLTLEKFNLTVNIFDRNATSKDKNKKHQRKEEEMSSKWNSHCSQNKALVHKDVNVDEKEIVTSVSVINLNSKVNLKSKSR